LNRFFKISPIIFSLVTLLLLAMPANAQRRTCGADEVLQRQLEENPQMRQIREEIERQTQEFISHQGASDRGGMIITIPVVVHVVYFNSTQNITDAQIMSQIDVLNADFRRTNADAGSVPAPFQGVATDCEINFCMAKQDPNGFPTTGIERRETTVNGFSKLNNDVKFFSSGGLDIWDRNRYLNIWVCNTDVLGIAQFPGGPASTDGIVCDYAYFGNINATAPYDKGRTATHEIGHWLNCFHIWRDDGCNNSDLVADTPNQDDENFGCPSFPTVSCNNGPDGDMFMNYMDYTDDACMFMFTAGQKSRMQAVLNGSRASLMNSLGCKDPCSPPYTVTHINANTLFGTDMNMLGDIHVHSNAELVIEAEIRMPQGTRILVERNARLVIGTGGKVTRLCNNWEGIQVLGNSKKAQPEHDAPLTDPDQAGIVWIDGGTVEWARNGVTAGGGYGPEFWGGLIRTSNNAIFQSNAIFQNNRKDVEFMSYKFAPNKSSFLNTTFIEIGNAFDNTEGVTIWETDGILFENCIFRRKDREGIYTYDAGVSIMRPKNWTVTSIKIR
jgi:Pregnancy-associated plasma protein-A